MTLRYDLSLAHLSRRHSDATLLAGGMEATFRPDLLLDLAPFDLVVLGEGENPLLAIAERIACGGGLEGIPGTAHRRGDGRTARLPQNALDRDALAKAVFRTPYRDMPYRRYWDRLEQAYRVGSLPFKADREAALSEIRSVRFATLNYCPMGCSFCSSTNFLHQAQGSTARVARLTADECLDMAETIIGAFPDVRTILFQDDIFVFTKDERIEPLCRGIVAAKARGDLPEDLQFISTNRIDSMTWDRLRMMSRAGFRVLGFGIESFSPAVLKEFQKSRIVPFIEPVLGQALSLGITPFLDLILASPRSTLADVIGTLASAHRWISAGCEVGIYPYVIPFSGAAMAQDPEHDPFTVFERCSIPGTDVSWTRAAKILPHDALVRDAVLEMELTFEELVGHVREYVDHLPSRLRSLLWILSGSLVIDDERGDLPSPDAVLQSLLRQCPPMSRSHARRLEASLLGVNLARATG
jgi:radical SAM superfamily enzyme YgiQ (UPF0313 family)